jgi:hypothetical protein
MATPINYAEMFSDPEFLRQMQEAQAAAVAQTPMQPQVQGIEAPSMSASFSMTEMPKSEKEIQAAIRQKFMESQAQQEEQMKQQKALLAQEMERQKQLGVLGRLDLRPFAQALQQYGSTTAVVPTSAPTDRLDAIKQLQEQIQRGQRGLTQDQIGFLRTMMEDKRNSQLGQSQENFDLRLRSTINSSEEAKKVRSIGVLNQKLTALEDIVNKTGPTLTGEEKAKLDSTFEDAKMAIKNSYELGALTGPDVGIIEGALGKSPTSLAGIGKYAISGGKKGLISRIGGARSRAINEGKSHLESLKAVFPYEKASGIYSDLNKKLEIPESEADKIRKEIKALKGE